MIVINLEAIGVVVLKSLATVFVLSLVTLGFLAAIGGDLDRDDALGCITGVAALAFVASLAGFILFFTFAVVWLIWR